MTEKRIAIHYGTETGNSQSIAEKLAEEAERQGFTTSIDNLVNVSATDLAAEKAPVVIVISTWYNGKPPFNAERFCRELEEGRSAMNGLRFAVIALGDRHYRNFCACGRFVDEKLAELGGTRLVPHAELNAEDKDAYSKWETGFFEALHRQF